ncbi:hypothetical protein EG829_12215 [bacterium]|nr:hypothetical protein [bacterium]
MTDEHEAKRTGAQAQVDLEAEVKASLLPLREGEFSAKIDKILVYTQSAVRSADAKARDNFIRFAHLNLDAVLVQALESLVFRPRLASKSDEQKKAAALQKTFDRMDHLEKALLEHYVASSDPLNKYLAAGPWGHQYLQRRGIDAKALEAFDIQLCELLGCGDTAAGRIVLAYAGLSHLLDQLKGGAN